jgi:YEATS domain-containing protein 4
VLLVIETPPYEITEHGWGEFELNIKIHFVDPLEVSFLFSHLSSCARE